MNALRLARRCWAVACLLVAATPAPAPAQKKDGPALEVRVYSSLLPSVNKSDARAFSRPLGEFVGRRIDVPINVDVHEGTSPKDLFEFGRKLNDGEYHVGAVWGVEYGWLREKYPKLRALVVVSYGDKEMPNHTQIFVRKESAPSKLRLSDLKGRRLAVCKDTPLMDRLFVREMFREEKLSEKDFFAPSEPFANAKLAAAAVKNGKADCVIMNSQTYVRLRSVHPGLAESLESLKTGPVYPESVLVGSPEAMERLRRKKGLWADLRQEFLDAYTSPEGKECINFWRFQSFVAPDDKYERQVDKAVRTLPVKELLTLE